MSKKEQEASDKVQSYLKQQNRPYSTNDIFLNLHKEFGKTAVQKSLDSLVQDGLIKEKTYGKQKVYVASQDACLPLDEANLKAMETRIKDLTDELTLRTKELTESESKFKTLCSSLTTEEAQQEIAVMEEEMERMEGSLSKLASKGAVVSEQEKERISCDRERTVKEWRKRKRLALDILDAILDGYPKSKKELYDEIGVETDQDAGVDISLFS